MAIDGQGKKVSRMEITMLVEQADGSAEPMILELLRPNTHLEDGDVQLKDGSVNEYVMMANPSGMVSPEDFKASRYWREAVEHEHGKGKKKGHMKKHGERHAKGAARRAAAGV